MVSIDQSKCIGCGIRWAEWWTAVRWALIHLFCGSPEDQGKSASGGSHADGDVRCEISADGTQKESEYPLGIRTGEKGEEKTSPFLLSVFSDRRCFMMYPERKMREQRKGVRFYEAYRR